MWSQEWRGPQTDKTPAAKFHYRTIFLITTFGIAFYQFNLSTGYTVLSSRWVGMTLNTEISWSFITYKDSPEALPL
jgi:hypothetical protein